MRISSLPTQKTWKIDAGPVLRLLFTAKCRQIISRNSSESGTFLSFFFQVWDGGLFYSVGKFNFDVRTPRSLGGIFFLNSSLLASIYLLFISLWCNLSFVVLFLYCIVFWQADSVYIGLQTLGDGVVIFNYNNLKCFCVLRYLLDVIEWKFYRVKLPLLNFLCKRHCVRKNHS